jgi:hypothetical protein
MITITGWVRYDCGEVFLTFADPKNDDFDNSLVIACGDGYEGGDKRTYLKTITTDINPSFWDHFTTDELDSLIDDADDISFEICMIDGDIRTLIKTRKEFIQESDPEDNEDEIKNNEQVVSKQKTEAFYSSISSLI